MLGAAVLYSLGDCLAQWMAAYGVEESDVETWHGYWCACVTSAISQGKDRLRDNGRRLAGAIRVCQVMVQRAGSR